MTFGFEELRDILRDRSPLKRLVDGRARFPRRIAMRRVDECLRDKERSSGDTVRMTSRHRTTGMGGGRTVRPICVRRRQRQRYPSVDIRGLDQKKLRTLSCLPRLVRVRRSLAPFLDFNRLIRQQSTGIARRREVKAIHMAEQRQRILTDISLV